MSSEVALGQRFSAPRNLELIILRVVEVRDGESWCKDALCPALFCGKCDQRGSVQPALIEVVSQIGEDPLQRFPRSIKTYSYRSATSASTLSGRGESKTARQGKSWVNVPTFRLPGLISLCALICCKVLPFAIATFSTFG